MYYEKIVTDMLLTPEEYIKCCTCEDIIIEKDQYLIDNIHNILKSKGIEDDDWHTIWDYSLSDIEFEEDGADIVLVDVSRIDLVGQQVKEVRWFECPDEFNIMNILDRK